MPSFVLEILAYAGGSAALAYLLFIWLGRRVVEHWFTARMEVYRNAQAKELEEYKYKINALFNRVTKIHEREFEVLPRAWELLQLALGKIGSMSSPLQSYPELKSMTERQFSEFLTASRLRDHEKVEIATAPDRNKYYQEKMFWHDLNDARAAVAELHNYLLYNKIFLSKDLFEEFGKVDRLLFDSTLELESRHDAPQPGSTLSLWRKITEEALQIAETIARHVQERLHYSDVQ